LAMIGSSTAFAGPAMRPVVQQSTVSMGLAELKDLAKQQNPIIGYYDPLNLGSWNLYGKGEEATIGFLRQAEIKHGRVAMAAFVGFIVQANGIHWPWALTTSGITHADIAAAGSPPAQWDALPEVSKYQIIAAVGFLEIFSEHSYILEAQGQKHYMKGGKPGFFPSLRDGFKVHNVPYDLYDPLNFSANRTPEQKAKGLIAEVNNGRLAMIGIMGFLAETSVPGSVPFGPHMPWSYDGEIMAPFAQKIWPEIAGYTM